MRTGHRYLDDGPDVIAFAHRGGAGHPDLTGLENTRLAFAHAVSLGYRYLETDVHVTRDDVLVAFHDDLLDRLSATPGRIEDLTEAELSEVRVAGREPVPRLVDLVEAFPTARFNVDLKTAGAVAPLARYLRRAALEDRVLVASFSVRRLRRFRALAGPRVATAAHPLEVLAFLVLPGRLAALVTRGRPAALQIPHRRGPLVIASRAVVRRAHAAGVAVHVWTVDDPDEMRLLLDRGVDGLMTDRTDILKDVLTERGEWHDPVETR